MNVDFSIQKGHLVDLTHSYSSETNYWTNFVILKSKKEIYARVKHPGNFLKI